MKTKSTLRTKIIVTTAGLVALTGIFYAANPQPFATVNTPQSPLRHPPNHPAANPQPFAIVNGGGPIGVAASKTDVIATEYCTENIDKIDHLGNVSLFATIPGPLTCGEKYLTIAPLESASATPAPFTPRDIFVTQGSQVFKVSGNPVKVTLFATLSSCGADHTGITFDHV